MSVSVLIAVGTVIADRPPHRPVRAELPHTVLTANVDVQTSRLHVHPAIHAEEKGAAGAQRAARSRSGSGAPRRRADCGAATASANFAACASSDFAACANGAAKIAVANNRPDARVAAPYQSGKPRSAAHELASSTDCPPGDAF